MSKFGQNENLWFYLAFGENAAMKATVQTRGNSKYIISHITNHYVKRQFRRKFTPSSMRHFPSEAVIPKEKSIVLPAPLICGKFYGVVKLGGGGKKFTPPQP